jgi:hypothetical protein
MRALFLVLRGAGALAYGASALVQLNDPDPLLWFAIYAAGAVLVLLPVGPWVWRAHAGLAAVALLWSATLVPGALALPGLTMLAAEMEAATPAIELAREALGLLLVAAGLGGRAWATRHVVRGLQR